jgi:hypothetical protein
MSRLILITMKKNHLEWLHEKIMPVLTMTLTGMPTSEIPRSTLGMTKARITTTEKGRTQGSQLQSNTRANL